MWTWVPVVLMASYARAGWAESSARWAAFAVIAAGAPACALAGVLAAGLDGIDNERDPGQRLDINMYTEGHKLRRIKRLPLNIERCVFVVD